MPPITATTIAHYPTLITGPWCPFTAPAAPFWREVARRCGLTMREVSVESPEGTAIVYGAGVAGVPCVLAAPGRLYYGYQVSATEAAAFLRGDAAPQPPGI